MKKSRKIWMQLILTPPNLKWNIWKRRSVRLNSFSSRKRRERKLERSLKDSNKKSNKGLKLYINRFSKSNKRSRLNRNRGKKS
jgi:hypothetical protein